MMEQERAHSSEAIETVAFDVEGTLTTGTVWEGVRDYLAAEGEKSRYGRFQRRMLPRYLLFRLNLGNTQGFKEKWVAGILRLLAGRSRAEIDELAARITEEQLWPQRREEVLAELNAHKAAGRRVLLVSGQFQPFLEAFVVRVGADAGIGTPGMWQGDRFSGELAAPFTVGDRKAELLAEQLDGRLLYAAYGDSGTDGPLLAMSERPTAVYPDETLRRSAYKHGWRIIAPKEGGSEGAEN